MTDKRIAWRNSSASQISNFRKCPRRWWWEKVAGYKTPTSPAMETGTRIHAELEAYLRDGTLPTDPIAMAGLEFLPEPETVDGINVERKLTLEGAGLPVPIIGFVDLVEPPGAGQLIPTITDHKTTSDFRYIKSPEVLAHDPQAIIYSEFALTHLFPSHNRVTFRHVYYRTRGRPDSRESRVDLSLLQVGKRFEGIVKTVQAQAEARQKDITDIEPVLSACGDYGGCPFQTNCNKAGGMGCNASIFAGINSKAKNNERSKGMGLLDKIKSKQQQPQEAPVEAVTINPPDGVPMDQAPPEPAQPELVANKDVKALSVAELFEHHNQLVSGLSDADFTRWQESSPLALWHAEGRSNKRGAKPKKQEVLDDVLRINALGTTLKDVAEHLENGKPLPQVPEVDSKAQAVTEVTEDAADDNDAFEDDFEASFDSSQWSEPDEDPFEDTPPMLFVGCIPRPNAANKNSVGKMVWLDEMLARHQATVAENRGVAHYSLVDFAKGEKEVAALLKQDLESRRGLPRILIADRRMSGVGPSIEVLIQLYPIVVDRLG